MKTNIIGLKDLRENMGSYLAQIEKGKSFVVVRKSKPVFKVVPIDEWGDEGNWKTIIDFREIHPDGIPAEDFLRYLKKASKK